MPVLSLRRRQTALVGLLFAGYASLYFCRADLSVATPLLVEELQARGLSQQDALLRMGTEVPGRSNPTNSTMRAATMSIADDVFTIFQQRGSGAYFGERVSMTEHALQAAYFAREESAPPTLIVAALLHDIGLLVEDVPDELGDWTADTRHEEIGARWLAQRLQADVAGPVRLHVPAKRYLCATDTNYVAMLSHASLVTLKLQGGPMPRNELLQFETQRYSKDAIRLRRWDDRGKVSGLKTPGLSEYRELIQELALRD